MRILIVGLGVQGNKRKNILKGHKILTVDTKNNSADYKNIKQVPLNSFDVVFLCVPDKEKYSLIEYFAQNKKHILVEKPLFLKNIKQFYLLQKIANRNNILFTQLIITDLNLTSLK